MINSYEISIKDYRNQKYGVEVDIEIKSSKQRGFAILKIWGPSEPGKKCTLMVSKNKFSEEKFTTLLSRKVIKPLIDSHIKGEDLNALIVKVNQNNDKINCRKCKKSVNKIYL